MGDFLFWVLRGLVPPHDAEGNAVYRWRVMLVVIVMSNSLGIVVGTILSLGIVPAVFQGFAHTRDVVEMGQQFSDVQRNQLDSKILDTRTRQCASIATKNQGALLFATARLQGELEAWSRLTQGRDPYRLPPCEEL